MESTLTRQDILEQVESEIREILLADARDGANDHAYVRINRDGSVYSGREPSYSLTIDEYERKEPHTLTVFSRSGLRESAGFEDNVFEWEEWPTPRDLTEDEQSKGFRQAQGEAPDLYRQGTVWYSLSRQLLEPFDVADIMSEVESRMDECDWLPGAEEFEFTCPKCGGHFFSRDVSGTIAEPSIQKTVRCNGDSSAGSRRCDWIGEWPQVAAETN
jgi:hypothetical protein